MAGINRKKRKDSFMAKPATGWLHDDRALNAGRGVYVRCGFPSTDPAPTNSKLNFLSYLVVNQSTLRA